MSQQMTLYKSERERERERESYCPIILLLSNLISGQIFARCQLSKPKSTLVDILTYSLGERGDLSCRIYRG